MVWMGEDDGRLLDHSWECNSTSKHRRLRDAKSIAPCRSDRRPFVVMTAVGFDPSQGDEHG
jgi:hypothetical protein